MSDLLCRNGSHQAIIFRSHHSSVIVPMLIGCHISWQVWGCMLTDNTVITATYDRPTYILKNLMYGAPCINSRASPCHHRFLSRETWTTRGDEEGQRGEKQKEEQEKRKRQREKSENAYVKEGSLLSLSPAGGRWRCARRWGCCQRRPNGQMSQRERVSGNDTAIAMVVTMVIGSGGVLVVEEDEEDVSCRALHHMADDAVMFGVAVNHN